MQRQSGQSRWHPPLIKNFKIAEHDAGQYSFRTVTGQDVPRSWQFALRVTF